MRQHTCLGELLRDLTSVPHWVAPLRFEEFQPEREHVVVDEAAVDGEAAHHEEHVAAAEGHRFHLAQAALRPRALHDKEVHRGARQDEAVSDITVHDAEEEGEGDGGEERRDQGEDAHLLPHEVHA